MSRTMTNTERERFLADVHIDIISIAEDGRGPLTRYGILLTKLLLVVRLLPSR